MTTEQLASARDKLCIDKATFAERLGVCSRTYRRWETGRTSIPQWVPRLLRWDPSLKPDPETIRETFKRVYEIKF